MARAILLILLSFIILSTTLAQSSRPRKRTDARQKQHQADVIYYPTPPATVEAMLRAAKIQKEDVLYDLGSGDGRIPIKAAQDYGIRAVGVEIDPKLVADATEAAEKLGVANKVKFRVQNFFRTDLREATIVTLYLSDTLNVALLPKILNEMRPGSRIVSHDFLMGNWKPEQTIRVPWQQTLFRTVYVWTVPEKKSVRKRRLQK